MEPVFRTLEIAAEAAVRVTGTAITFQGREHIPPAAPTMSSSTLEEAMLLDQAELAERARRQAGRD